jgi:hypothetical protein
MLSNIEQIFRRNWRSLVWLNLLILLNLSLPWIEFDPSPFGLYPGAIEVT